MDGQVFVCGFNPDQPEEVQHAVMNGIKDYSTLKRISALKKYRVVQLSSIYEHCVALTACGRVLTWGVFYILNLFYVLREKCIWTIRSW